MASAGCRLIEVGTTNRTRAADFERAINEQTAVLLKTHTSNFRLVGFHSTPGLDELVPLARSHRLLAAEDAPVAEIAARLGTVPDVAQRALRSLADEGLLEVTRQQIIIRDLEGRIRKAKQRQ